MAKRWNASELKSEYKRMWATAKIDADAVKSLDYWVRRIGLFKNRYQKVADATGVPWFVIGLIHMREASLKFNGHLHNGDPLSARTRQVPAGRPLRPPAAGPGKPFSWEESAVDALTYKGLNKWNDWSIPGILYVLESWNGWGYKNYGVTNPYVWANTNHYTSGKFVRDGKYSPNAKDKQPGTAAVLKYWLDSVQRATASTVVPKSFLNYAAQ